MYSVAIFAPTIINQFQPGHTTRHAQALVIPIFVAALVVCLLAAYASDKLKHRAGFAFFGYILTIIGAALLFTQKHHTADVKYAALYFMACGSYISLPMIWTMLINNVSGSYKIGIAIAIEVGVGNIGGIASAWIFRGSQAPLYVTGYTTLITMSTIAAALVVVYSVGLLLENKARDAGKRDYRLSEPDSDNLGDDHPNFRYSC